MKKSLLNLTIVLGTARNNRESLHVAKLIQQEAEKIEDFSVQFVDVKDIMTVSQTIPNWDNTEELKKTEKWRTIVKNSEAFVFVIPEYNHGYPGELKLLIDQAPVKSYIHKPVVTCGVSRGELGGARVIEHSLQLWGGIGAVFAGSIRTAKVEELLDDNGKLTDPKYAERVQKTLKQLAAYADGMQHVRKLLV